MKQERPSFVIAVNWNDRWFLPACISSIRRFYPDAHITLLKDTFCGPVPTSRLERAFRVSSHPVKRAFGGGGWIKLLPAIIGEEARAFSYPLMILDTDTIMLGPVYEVVAQVGGSVVASPDPFVGSPLNEDYISKSYLVTARLREMGVDAGHIQAFPWFYAGQLLVREPYLEFEFVQRWINWESAPITKRDPLFYALTDQSLLNHFCLLNSQVRLGIVDFMDLAGSVEAGEAARPGSRYKQSNERILHYAGASTQPFWRMPDWKPFFKENNAAERVLGNWGSLVFSHTFQLCARGLLSRLGAKGRNRLKRMLFSEHRRSP